MKNNVSLGYVCDIIYVNVTCGATADLQMLVFGIMKILSNHSDEIRVSNCHQKNK